MTSRARRQLTDRGRARGIRVAGLAIIALGVGAALLPAADTISSDMIGAMLIAAGLVETVAGSLRGEIKPYAMAAGAVTALAGLLFVIDPETHFFPIVTPIIGWLLIRSLILVYASTHLTGSVRTWMGVSAGVDFLLAALLIAGLSIATIIVSLFGPTQELIASFAWVLAASFVANGLLLLEVASCERSGYAGA
jgi:hypothetical protein